MAARVTTVGRGTRHRHQGGRITFRLVAIGSVSVVALCMYYLYSFASHLPRSNNKNGAATRMTSTDLPGEGRTRRGQTSRGRSMGGAVGAGSSNNVRSSAAGAEDVAGADDAVANVVAEQPSANSVAGQRPNVAEERSEAYQTRWHGGPPPTPPYWLENDPDDSFERIYLTDDERPRYKHLRNLGKGGSVNKGLGIKHNFNPMCRHYRFDESAMPTVSVIMTTQNEPHDWVSLSVESILARTPPDLLVEVIVVDDNGVPGHHGLPENIRLNVDESEWDYIRALSPKVKVIKHDDREGCARSRLTGAKAATGEVLMFVDSHIEMLSGTWYQHLASTIVENPHTIAMQLIDVVDDLGTKDYGGSVGPEQFGIVNTEFWFGYQADRFGDYTEPIDPGNYTEEEIVERKGMKYKVETPSAREPYETPVGPGSLFAIRADEFWRLGGYDEGLYVWGGENTEMAFKIWMCGGRMIMVPCSRVGHMYRQHKEKDGRGALTRWPPTLPTEMTDRLGCAYRNGTYVGKFIVLKHPADNFTRITTRNNLRVMETWVGDHPAKYGKDDICTLGE
jgi:polypeptide N-acetylgalactosaminyltransferase